MNTWIPWLVSGGVALGCTPKSNDAGVLDTGSVSDEGDDGAETSGNGGSGTSDGGNDGMSSTPTSGVDDGSDDVATGEVLPSACVEMGWDASYATFMQMASAASNTYWYTSEAGGDYGFGHDCLYRTTVVVESGAVVRREFEIVGPPESDPDFECTSVPYVEEGEELGTHDESQDREPWTLEQLYEGCCQEVLTQPADENYLTFEVDRQGLLSACSYFPTNCADGCDAGPEGYGMISIASIAFGPWSP